MSTTARPDMIFCLFFCPCKSFSDTIAARRTHQDAEAAVQKAQAQEVSRARRLAAMQLAAKSRALDTAFLARQFARWHRAAHRVRVSSAHTTAHHDLSRVELFHHLNLVIIITYPGAFFVHCDSISLHEQQRLLPGLTRGFDAASDGSATPISSCRRRLPPHHAWSLAKLDVRHSANKAARKFQNPGKGGFG